MLPPLRERREEIAPLFLELVRQHAGGRPPAVEAKMIEALCIYDWPLNVRELVLLARRLLGLHGHEPALKKAHLPERMIQRSKDAPSSEAAPDNRRARHKTDDEAEFETLLAALRAHGGSVAKAAAAIGVSRARAYRVLSARPDFSLEKLR